MNRINKRTERACDECEVGGDGEGDLDRGLRQVLGEGAELDCLGAPTLEDIGADHTAHHLIGGGGSERQCWV